MTSPLQKIELLKTFLSLLVAWVVLMGFYQMTPEQQALTISVVIAGVNLGGAWWQDQLTTSLSNPKAADGEPLVRASGSLRSPAEKGDK